MDKKHTHKKHQEERRQSIFAALEHLFFPKKKESTGILWFLILVTVGLFGLIGYLVYDISQKTGHDVKQIAQAFTILPASPTPMPSPTPTPVPFAAQPLQDAYVTMNNTETMEASFRSDATVRTTSQIDNRQQSLNIGVQGYVRGSTKGAPLISEMTVTEKGSGQGAQVGMAITRNGAHYIKAPNTPADWDERQMSQYPRIYENLPLDGSTFGFNFIETFFSPQNALFSSLDRGSIREEQLQQNGVSYIRYSGNLSMPTYFEQLDRDQTVSAESRENMKKTLRDASVSVTLLVNSQTSYVEQVSIQATNLSQIAEDRSVELGYDSRYDVQVECQFSSFNKPVEELVPEKL
jgi:predicted RNA binding protein with dsRBD fold (UPF0201 family)